MNSITQTARFRLSAIKFAKRQGVTKATREFSVSRQTIYRWRKKYDGTFESLKDKSRRLYHHPNQHSQEELDLIKEMREKYPHDGLNMFWYRLSCMDYTRSMSALFRVIYSFNGWSGFFLSKFGKCKRTTASSLLKDSQEQRRTIKPYSRNNFKLMILSIKEYALIHLGITAKWNGLIAMITNIFMLSTNSTLWKISDKSLLIGMRFLTTFLCVL